MGIGPIIVLGITLLFGVFMYFIVVRSNKKNKLLMDSLKEDEIKSNLSIEELEKKSTEKKKRKELEDKTWKQTRIGLFIFILPHVIFEQVLFELYGSFGSNVVMVPVVVNFYITRYFIKGLIFERSETKNILYGLGISIIVFSIRLLLGVLFSLSVS
tara:strand:- start:206 stop:676 length:471 start_codon:yes stop_codon:yes gene_type:complete